MARKKNTTRKDGLIAVQVYLGRSADGKRRYKTVYGKTQPEVDAKAEQIKVSLSKGLDVTAEHDTFETWSRRWLKIKMLEVSHSQAANYKTQIDYFETTFLRNAQITKIKPIDLQEIINTLAVRNPNTEQPTSKRQLQMVKSTMSQVFELAIENRVLEFNPAASLKIPKSAPVEKRRALTDNEQKWITLTEHRAKTAAMLMMYAGLRRGELIPLTWNDIDLEAKTISVSKSVEKRSNEFVVKSGAKTAAGERSIDIPDVLVNHLESLKHDSIYVCSKTDGGMHTESSWKRMWESYLLELNVRNGDFRMYKSKPKSRFDRFGNTGVPFVIDRITPHMLRHTFATLLYLAEVDILTAKEQLGHSDIKMTLGIYTHLDKVHKRKSMSKLNVFLNDASNMQVVAN